MQMLEIRKDGDSKPQKLYVQQIYVYGLHDAEKMWHTAHQAIIRFKELGFKVQYFDDEIPEATKNHILQNLE
jgi:hypothetical protein